MRNFIFIFSLFISGYCLAQKPKSFNKGGATVKKYITEVPYQMINGKILIDVELAGKKHKFLLDTWAPTAISASLAAEIKAPGIGKAALDDAGGRSDSVAFVKVDSLKLGGVTFSGIPAMGSIPDFMKCMQADGIIGSNLLRNSVLGIKISPQILVITDQPEKLMIDKSRAAPMTVDSMQSSPQIAVNFNGLVGTIPFDTGMREFMYFKEEWIKALQQNKIVFETIDKGFGSSWFGAFGPQPAEEKQLLKFPAIQIGNGRFEHVYTETIKAGTPVIGTRLLDYGNVILDYINKQYYFFPKTATIDMEEKHWPVDLTIKDGKLIIGTTWGRSNGLVKIGEQILNIDGRDYTQHVELCDLIAIKPTLKDKTTLIVKDAKGKTRTVVINKE